MEMNDTNGLPYNSETVTNLRAAINSLEKLALTQSRNTNAVAKHKRNRETLTQSRNTNANSKETQSLERGQESVNTGAYEVGYNLGTAIAQLRNSHKLEGSH